MKLMDKRPMGHSGERPLGNGHAAPRDNPMSYGQGTQLNYNLPGNRNTVSNNFQKRSNFNGAANNQEANGHCVILPNNYYASPTLCDVGFKPCSPMIPASIKNNRLHAQYNPQFNQLGNQQVIQPYNQNYIDQGNTPSFTNPTHTNFVHSNGQIGNRQNGGNIASLSSVSNLSYQSGFNKAANAVNTGFGILQPEHLNNQPAEYNFESEINELLSDHGSYKSHIQVPRFNKCTETATEAHKNDMKDEYENRNGTSNGKEFEELISLKQIKKDLQFNRDWRLKIDPTELSNKLNSYISQQAKAKKANEFGDVISKVNALAVQIEKSTKTFLGKNRKSANNITKSIEELCTKNTKLVLKDNIEPITKVLDSKVKEFLIRPFASEPGNDKNIVDIVVPDAKKDWHLQAIKHLSKSEFSMLKLPMLELVNSKTNIDPDKLCFKASLIGTEEPKTVAYKIIQEGTFGVVYEALISSVPCAVKTPSPNILIKDPFGILKRIVSEWLILGKCKHNHIVKLIGGIVLGAYDVWLATRLTEGMDLCTLKHNSLGKNISIRGEEMCRQLAEAITYLHTPMKSKGVVIHRDIKPENIIVDKNFNITLCDFGDAVELKNGIEIGVSGATWLYAPPELLVLDPLNVKRSSSDFEQVVTVKWDVWSMGCVFQEMLGFPNPFYRIVKGKDPYKALVEHAENGMVPWIPNSLLSTIIGDVIKRSLSNDPLSRPTADEILQLIS